MNEATVRLLLSYAVRSLLDEEEKGATIEDRDAFAKKVANMAFDALSVALRDCFVKGEELSLTDIGIFKPNSEVKFIPASPLLDAEALRLRAEEGTMRLAQQAAFYLGEGLELLRLCGRNALIAEDGILSPAQQVMRQIFGEKAGEGSIFDYIDGAQRDLKSILHRLEPAIEKMSVPSEQVKAPFGKWELSEPEQKT